DQYPCRSVCSIQHCSPCTQASTTGFGLSAVLTRLSHHIPTQLARSSAVMSTSVLAMFFLHCFACRSHLAAGGDNRSGQCPLMPVFVHLMQRVGSPWHSNIACQHHCVGVFLCQLLQLVWRAYYLHV